MKFIIVSLIVFILICDSCILYVIASSLCELTKSIKDMTKYFNAIKRTFYDVDSNLSSIERSLRKIKEK